jgi:hypothetical protein
MAPTKRANCRKRLPKTRMRSFHSSHAIALRSRDLTSSNYNQRKQHVITCEITTADVMMRTSLLLLNTNFLISGAQE